jgi:hypothetical protein
MAMILKSITLLFHVKHFEQKKYNPHMDVIIVRFLMKILTSWLEPLEHIIIDSSSSSEVFQFLFDGLYL